MVNLISGKIADGLIVLVLGIQSILTVFSLKTVSSEKSDVSVCNL